MNIKDWIEQYQGPWNGPQFIPELDHDDHLTDSELREILYGEHNYVKEEGAGYLIQHTDPEVLKNHIPELLVWIQDMNWPAALYVHHALVGLGEYIIDHVRTAFENEPFDSIWQGNMIWVLSKLNTPRMIDMKVKLIKTVKRADDWGASVSALELLYDNNLLSLEEVKKYCDFLRAEYVDYPYCLDDLAELVQKIN